MEVCGGLIEAAALRTFNRWLNAERAKLSYDSGDMGPARQSLLENLQNATSGLNSLAAVQVFASNLQVEL